jgi:hypothetical protein
MVSPLAISRATLDGSVYDPHTENTTTIYNINSLMKVVQAQYDRSKQARQRSGNRSTLYAINDATNQLNLVTQKKQELITKKKLVI